MPRRIVPALEGPTILLRDEIATGKQKLLIQGARSVTGKIKGYFKDT